MSCYFRHLKDVFAEAGVEITPQNKKQLDQAIHRFVEVTYKDCSPTWNKLKQKVLADEGKRRALVEMLRETAG